MKLGVKNKKALSESFQSIVNQYQEDDKSRETILSTCREIIRPSKQAIYSIHRNDLIEANKLLTIALKNINEVSDLLEKSDLKNVGAFKAALEEYVEAKTYLSFVESNTICLPESLPKLMHYETYLGGISDLTGELAKRAVVLATKEEFEKVDGIKLFIEEIHELFLSFDFRSGELRKKAESIKYNLSKVENILYDISIRRR